MTDKELKKLSREDLLEMLVSQSKEVERLKQEKTVLISQVRHFQAEFQKIGSLDAILNRLGYQGVTPPGTTYSALDELLLQYENEESTSELFEKEEVPDSEDETKSVKKKQTKKKPDVQSRLKEALEWTKMQVNKKK